MLAQTWVDQYGPGASGETFGALAAITATGRDVSVDGKQPSLGDGQLQARARMGIFG